MPEKRIMFILLVTVVTWMGAASAAHAQSREAGLSPGEEVLEPRPDGSYFLPVPGMESMTLRFEPGEMPIELAELWIDDGGSLVADLRYTGEKTVTAWKVKLASVRPGGREGSGVIVGQDWAASGPPDRYLPPGWRSGGSGDVPGPIEQGDVRSVALGQMTEQDASEVMLTVSLLVFEDTSYSGEDRIARDVLESRARGAEELAHWLERIGEILELSSNDSEITDGLREILDDIEGREIPPGPRSMAATTTVRGLQLNLESLLEPDPLQRSIRSRLETEFEWERENLKRWLRHVPETLPEEEGPRRQWRKVEEGPGGDPVGDTELDCECGGSIRDYLSRNQVMACNTEGGWTVSESWNIDCLNESGSKFGANSGAISGFGRCDEDFVCYPDTYCPPEFTGPTVSEQEGTRYWVRTVSNRTILHGPCTARCGYVDPPGELVLTCPCNPMPRPRCFADGCPILIETGDGGFELTDAADGVDFDLVGHGVPSRVAWTEPGGDDAWLVLDRNGNGRIDDATELFGDRTPQPAADERHGFLALAVFDDPAHGGNGDGWIDAGDAIFDDLRLWLDHDHDGASALGELIPLASADIEAIELDFFRSGRRDRHGNRFRYSARVRLVSGGHRLATDVFLQFE